MGKHNYTHGSAPQQTKRFFADLLRGRSVDAQMRQLLFFVTTVFATTGLLFAAGGNALARPLFATAPSLGVASSFAVLGDSTVTNAGPGGTIVTGDVGVSTGTAVTGFQPSGTGVVNGTIYAGGPIAAQAKADATSAYANLTGQTCDFNYPAVAEVGGLTLTPGVHCFPSSVQVTGILTLDAQGGDPDDIFVFKIGSTLITASNAQVLVINSNNQACNVGLNNMFWAVGSSATIGVGTAFAGNILASVSNTVMANASVDGRVIALGGAVTLDTNLISRVCMTPPTITSNGGGTTASINMAENTTAVTTVIATGDPMPTYTINGGDDAAKFTINNSNGILTFITNPDFETPMDAGANNVYDILLRASNSAGFDDQALAVTVTNVSESLNSLRIASGRVDENAVSGTTVGTVSSVDEGAGITVTYSLVNGVGDAGNAYFTLVAGVLKTAAVFNYEVKNAYNIRVRVTDNTFLTFDRGFIILINDVNDAPVAVADVIDPAFQVISVPIDIFVLTNDTDQDISDSLSLSAVGVANSGTVVNHTTLLNYAPLADFNGVVSFAYTASDGTATDEENVTLTVVANDARGDCNSDGAVNAGDYVALVLEYFDTDASSNWYEIYQMGFAGSPMGCDANVSKSITIADLICTILVSFGERACTSSTPVTVAAQIADAELAVEQEFVPMQNDSVEVRVRLTTNGQRVAAAGFALRFDEEQLAWDGSDVDGNGLPDAITFYVPAGMVAMAHYNEETNRLEVSLYAVTMPMPILSDGVLMSVQLKIEKPPASGEVRVLLEQSSLSSDQGQAVPVQATDGAVDRTQGNQRAFLPLVHN